VERSRTKPGAQKKCRESPAFFIGPESAVSGVLALHRDRQFDSHVGVQRNGYRMLARGLDRTLRHANLRLFDVKALLAQRFGDVCIGDGTKQAAVNASLLRNLNSQAVQLFALRLSGSQLLAAAFSRSARLTSNSATAAWVARRAMRLGMRKLRA